MKSLVNLITLLGMLFFMALAQAAVEIPNKVKVTLAAEISYDANSGLFTYTYTALSDPASEQEVDNIVIPLIGSIINIQSPYGWTGRVNADGTMLSWCACEPFGIIIPPGYVDDGNVLPSIYQIKPGGSLGGFSFQSLEPPGSGTFHAGGFVRIPVEGVDFQPGEEPVIPDWPDNLYASQTQVPVHSENTNLFPGGRRPAVDGFLQFKNIKNRDAKNPPVVVEIVFAAKGEIVDQSTFRATLNSMDVTGKFVEIAPNQRRAVFPLGLGAVKSGRNVLLTTVKGVVPGTNRTATDTDRITFTVP